MTHAIQLKPDLSSITARLKDNARGWARLPIAEKIAVARRMREGFFRVAERSVLACCEAKGIAPGTPAEGEEWLIGPYCALRHLRLTIEALEQIARTGTTRIGKVSRGLDGKLRVGAYPLTLLDRLLFDGLSAEVVLEEGVDEAELERTRAAFYKEKAPEGRVCLVLGAGNVSSIAPMDVVTKLFNEGKVCVLKMNPVNEYLGPFLEEAFAEVIQRGWLAVVYGGGDVGGALCHDKAVDEIHITGSDKTHDLIVWGPPGPEREERKRAGKPLLDKPITSELGNVSPVIVVPGPYTRRELAWQAESIAGMVTNNASFNCNAAKMVVTAKGWSRNDELLSAVERGLSAAPVRKAYYPGAQERHAGLTAGRAGLRRVGTARDGELPWTVIPGLDATDAKERAFSTEPFCSVLSTTEVGTDDPVYFLERAVAFANERLWGTLSATVIVHPKTLRDPRVAEAFERALSKLRYGAIGVNIWPALAYALGTTPWGAHPGSSLGDIQSGRGFVHNTLQLPRIAKCIVRYPVIKFPKLFYFSSHRSAHQLGKRLAAMEAETSWLKVPGIVGAAMRG